MWEGGYRVPCVMRWPGKIPAGTTCDEFAVTMDLFPTVAGLIGANVPTDRVIDGKDIWPLMTGEPDATSPHDVFYCYYGRELRAVRDRRWKLFFPHRSNTLAGRPGGSDGTPARYEQHEVGRWLFDLKNDIGETTDVAAETSGRSSPGWNSTPKRPAPRWATRSPAAKEAKFGPPVS